MFDKELSPESNLYEQWDSPAVLGRIGGRDNLPLTHTFQLSWS